VPEGPEIRREADALGRALAGRELTQVEYRVAGLAAPGRRLRGARVLRVYPRGKALLIEFDCGVTHYSHNQLYGQWRVLRPGRAREDTRTVRVVLGTLKRVAVLYSATEIELLATDAVARHPYLAKLGPDVLAPATTVRAIAACIRDPRFARSSLAALLLDQCFIAGLGNYLRSEILHVARLPGSLRPGDLDDAQRDALARAIHALPRQSYRTRGITNDLASARTARAAGEAFEDYRFRVYGRAGLPCRMCGTPVARREAAGRGLFACPACQRERPRPR
jgi:endonuclease-8